MASAAFTLPSWGDVIDDTPARTLRAVSGEAFRVSEETAVASFADYIKRVNPKYVFYDHCVSLINALQKVADGEIERLMVFEPPRHGKSETVSRLFPAYYVQRFPDKFFGLASYAAQLAYSLSRNARGNYVRGGGLLAGDAQAVTQWETPSGGGMWAAGVGGPITGKGFHVGSIDDPLKNAEEALSETIRNKQWDWYQSTFLTRQEPGASQVLTLTRWHEDDLAGRVIEQARESGEVWHVLFLEAIKTDSTPDFPEQFVILDDHRESGRALCPERYSAEWLHAHKSKIGAYYFGALYQQTPRAPEGDLWKTGWFKVYDELPEVAAGGKDWDLAYTEKEANSASCYVESYEDAGGNIYIHDADWQWMEFPELIAWMRSVSGPHYVEAKASGKSAVQSLTREGITAIEVDVHGGDKWARTLNATPVAEAGKVYVRRSIFEKLMYGERQGLALVSQGNYTDLNDAVVQAINRHTDTHWLVN